MAFYSTSADDYSRRREAEDRERELYTEHQPHGDQARSPVYSPPLDKPPIPTGWVPQWDEQYQRWFYHDTTTGRSQWEAPGYEAALPDRGVGGVGAYQGGYRTGGEHGYGYGCAEEEKKKKSSSGHGGMLLGAAGGLAAGALLSNALHDDSDEYRSYPQGAPVQAPAYAESVSSSDRESLEEARQEYAEALDDARSSSASSSDHERLEEAREEYYSEEEEAYGSD
ncbi:hypothetical protein GE09DRAFT_1223339 [Coniochaeta sp. 2T2.1]|nr:hypothetical protein GE09DRAFT_1223339 [Coniochaeta sp. 2T2.1]